MENKILICLILIGFQSCDSINDGKRNLENLNRVNAGMSVNNVLHIMGKPIDTYNELLYDNTFSMQYSAPVGYSDNIYITFSKSDSLVLHKSDGSE